MSTTALPELMDARKIATELDIPVDAAYRIMEKLPKVRPDALKKVYVKRSDLAAYIAKSTVAA